MKKILLLVFSLLLLSCSCLAEEGGNYRVVAGILRNKGAGWYLLNDAYHKPVGLTAVEVVNRNIIIHFDFTAIKVGSLVVTPDETYATMGVQCGASVGMDLAIISVAVPYIYAVDFSTGEVLMPPGGYWNKEIPAGYTPIQNRFVYIDANTLIASGGNLWVYGIFEIE